MANTAGNALSWRAGAGGGFAARRLAGAYQGHILRLSAEGCSFG
jgi:hypothetical protein